MKRKIDMSRFSSKHTKPERQLRMMLVRKKIKFLCHPPIPGIPRRSADFRVGRLFIFVNGRYWHDPNAGTKSMNLFWRRKVRKNAERDLDTYKHLNACGYIFRVLWDDATEEERREVVKLAEAAAIAGPAPGQPVAS